MFRIAAVLLLGLPAAVMDGATAVRARWVDVQKMVANRDIAAELATGRRIDGHVTNVHEAGVTLRTSGGLTALAVSDIVRIRVLSPRSAWTGAAIGAAAGAAAAILLLGRGETLGKDGVRRPNRDYDLPALLGGVPGGIAGYKLARRKGGTTIEIIHEQPVGR